MPRWQEKAPKFWKFSWGGHPDSLYPPSKTGFNPVSHSSPATPSASAICWLISKSWKVGPPLSKILDPPLADLACLWMVMYVVSFTLLLDSSRSRANLAANKLQCLQNTAARPVTKPTIMTASHRMVPVLHQLHWKQGAIIISIIIRPCCYYYCCCSLLGSQVLLPVTVYPMLNTI